MAKRKREKTIATLKHAEASRTTATRSGRRDLGLYCAANGSVPRDAVSRQRRSPTLQPGPSANTSAEEAMKLKIVIHEAEEGGFWAEVPSIPGCAPQGDSFEELLSNLYEAVDGCLSVEVRRIPLSDRDRVIEIAV